MSVQNKTPIRSLAIFNSNPIKDYVSFSSAVMSIVSNKFDAPMQLLLHGEDDETKEHIARLVSEEDLDFTSGLDRSQVVEKMTDCILFCAVDNPALFKELSPYRDKGVRLYCIIQE